jgi:recombination protein RecT
MANAPAAPASPAAGTRSITPFEEVRTQLLSEDMKAQLLMALPPQMPPEKFQRVAITAINKNPDLLRCNRAALYGTFMLAAQDGLLPDGREGAIVMYGDKPQWMPMVGGLLKKIRNSGELKSLVCEVVYHNDRFERWIDEKGEHMRHEPMTFGERGEIIGAYALAMTKDDGVYIEVMTKEEVEKVRSVSKAKGAGPWTQWWDQMAKKTVIRRLSKRLPMSTDLEDVIRRDDELFDVEAKVVDNKTEAKKGEPQRLQKMLGGDAPTIDMPTGEEAEPAAETDKTSKDTAAKK